MIVLMSEGGLRVPFVIRYPHFHPDLQNGATLHAFSTVADLCPTILDLAGITHPVPPGQSQGQWHGRKVAGMRGKSWVKYGQRGHDSMTAIHRDDDPAIGWELFGRAGESGIKPRSPQPFDEANGRSSTSHRWQVDAQTASGSSTTCR